jgi:NADPH-dependent glutamate synthase beta subunit-like oxidoreductase
MVDTSTPSLGGLFVSGWIKRGPSGIIGTNIADAKDTVASIVDTVKLSAKPKPVSKSLQDLLQQRDVQIIDWKAYRRIDAAERSKDRIRNESQPREKITDRKEQLQAAFHKD